MLSLWSQVTQDPAQLYQPPQALVAALSLYPFPYMAFFCSDTPDWHVLYLHAGRKSDCSPLQRFSGRKIQRDLDPKCMPGGGWKELAALVPRTIVRELQKLMYYLPRALALLILSFIPLINLVTPLLWVLFSAWMIGIQYCDYAADNELVSFKDMKENLAQQRMQTMLFGGMVSLFTMIPIVNLVVMPAAVIGGSHLLSRETAS